MLKNRLRRMRPRQPEVKRLRNAVPLILRLRLRRLMGKYLHQISGGKKIRLKLPRLSVHQRRSEPVA